jgi:hypothetical protein
MAVKFLESFSLLPIGQLDKKWGEVNLTNGSVSLVRSRGGYGLKYFGTSLVTPNLGNHTTYIVGFGFQYADLGTVTHNIMHFYDDAVAQISLRIDPVTRFLIVNSGVDELATGTIEITSDTSHYIEVKGFADATTGTVEVRVNGVTDISLTNQTTVQSGNAQINKIGFDGLGSSLNYILDDIYILDGDGSVNNDFLGDMRVEMVVVNHEGDSSEWEAVPSDPVATPNPDNWEEVKQVDPERVRTATLNAKDLYGLKRLKVATENIAAVQISIVGRNENSTTHIITPILKSGGTEYNQTPIEFTDNALRTYSQVLDVSPMTGVAWTSSEFDNLQVGFKKSG